MSHSPSHARSKWAASVGVTSGIAVILIVACSGQVECREIPADSAAATILDDVASELGWEPVLPCGRTSGLTIGSANTIRVRGEPVLVLTVTRRDELRYVFTQAPASAGGNAIPIGTQRVSVPSAGVHATGFEGSDGSGGTMLYLRWQTGERFFEYQAALTWRYPRADAYRDARQLIARSVAAGHAN